MNTRAPGMRFGAARFDVRVLSERVALSLAASFDRYGPSPVALLPLFSTLASLEGVLAPADACALRDAALARGLLGAAIAGAEGHDPREGLALGLLLELAPTAAELSVTKGALALAPIFNRPLRARIRRAERAVGARLGAWCRRSVSFRRFPKVVLDALAVQEPTASSAHSLLLRAGSAGFALPEAMRRVTARLARPLGMPGLDAGLDRFWSPPVSEQLIRAMPTDVSGAQKSRLVREALPFTVLALEPVLDRLPDEVAPSLLWQAALRILEARVALLFRGRRHRILRLDQLLILLPGTRAPEVLPLLDQLRLDQILPVVLAGWQLEWRIRSAGATVERLESRLRPAVVGAFAAISKLKVRREEGVQWAQSSELLQAEALLLSRRRGQADPGD